MSVVIIFRHAQVEFEGHTVWALPLLKRATLCAFTDQATPISEFLNEVRCVIKSIGSGIHTFCGLSSMYTPAIIQCACLHAAKQVSHTRNSRRGAHPRPVGAQSPRADTRQIITAIPRSDDAQRSSVSVIWTLRSGKGSIYVVFQCSAFI
eukprot:7583029-Pyramimonas_sp.AAC.2